MEYLIERLGDISGKTSHSSFGEALFQESYRKALGQFRLQLVCRWVPLYWGSSSSIWNQKIYDGNGLRFGDYRQMAKVILRR